MKEAECLEQMVYPDMKRPTAYRKGIIQVWITRACDKSCFGCTQGSNLGGRQTMITPEQFEEAVISLKDYFGVVGVFGGNPCLANGSKVFTTEGIYPIEELEGKSFLVRNKNGKIRPAICFHSGVKRLYKVTLKGGHTVFATAGHEWPALELKYARNHKNKQRPNYRPGKMAVSLGKVKTKDLVPGMRLPIVKVDDLDFGSIGTRIDGFLAGWLIGDGWIDDRKKKKAPAVSCHGNLDGNNKTNSSFRLRRAGLFVSKEKADCGILSEIERTLNRLHITHRWQKEGVHWTSYLSGIEMDSFLDEFGLEHKKKQGLPACVWNDASEEFRIGLLDGLFSSDGEVEVSRERKYVRIRLTSSREQVVRDVSALLGFYGIKTSISKRTRKPKFPNKKDYGKEYVSYVLSIEGTSSVNHFAKLVKLTHSKKQQRLEMYAGVHKGDIESENIEIMAIEKTSYVEDVWDISVNDSTHTFQLAHCITGNCVHPRFDVLCELLRKHIPFERRGLWCNNLLGKGAVARATFNPAVCNLNVHLDQEAYAEFKRDWPESNPFGQHKDSRHAPAGWVSMQDLGVPEEERWELISKCDINRYWSAMIGVFRGELRGWFCEIAGAQSILHQENPEYPDTGVPVVSGWWQGNRDKFHEQVRHHCHSCGVPLRGYGSLAQDESGVEQVSASHADIYKTKKPKRLLQIVDNREQLQEQSLRSFVDYIGNAKGK